MTNKITYREFDAEKRKMNEQIRKFQTTKGFEAEYDIVEIGYSFIGTDVDGKQVIEIKTVRE